MDGNERLRMLRGVPRHYFNKRSELSSAIATASEQNLVYRTSLLCECTDCSNYRVVGAVVVSLETREVVCYLIKCRGCVKRKEATL